MRQKFEKQYLSLMSEILNEGKYRSKELERTGTGTKGVFGRSYICENVGENFPLLTTKDMSKSFNIIVKELLWKLSGSTNVADLEKQGIGIWTKDACRNYTDKNRTDLVKNSPKWNEFLKKEFRPQLLSDELFAKEWGDLGPTYGHNFRRHGRMTLRDVDQSFLNFLVSKLPNSNSLFDNWDTVVREGIDQLFNVINTIKSDPGNRRIIIDLWDPSRTKDMVLPPCPDFYQFAILDDKLHLVMYQRSADYLLGVPFNTAQESLLLMIVANITGYEPGNFIHMFGDMHLYNSKDHIDGATTQISRKPYKSPKVIIKRQFKVNDIMLDNFNITSDDFELKGYKYHDRISADMKT